MSEGASAEGDAAQAFEALRAEVSVQRRAIEALAAALQSTRPKDYTPTLGKIAKGLEDMNARLDSIEGHPALRLTPEHHQRAMAKAGSGLMHEVAQQLERATEAAASHGQHLAGVIGVARRQDQQLKWVVGTGAAALIVGLLISPILARLLPFGLDGRVAASILRGNRWEAGAALMQAENPEGWRGIVNDLNLVKTNQVALTPCREAAAKAKKEQRCMIVVPAP